LLSHRASSKDAERAQRRIFAIRPYIRSYLKQRPIEAQNPTASTPAKIFKRLKRRRENREALRSQKPERRTPRQVAQLELEHLRTSTSMLPTSHIPRSLSLLVLRAPPPSLFFFFFVRVHGARGRHDYRRHHGILLGCQCLAPGLYFSLSLSLSPSPFTCLVEKKEEGHRSRYPPPFSWSSMSHPCVPFPPPSGRRSRSRRRSRCRRSRSARS
jgi:hypothetical protein